MEEAKKSQSKSTKNAAESMDAEVSAKLDKAMKV